MLGYSRAKIARAKNSCHDLAIMTKTVGSNFFLKDRRLSASFKKGGFDALSAEAGAESATSQPSSNSYWLAVLDPELGLVSLRDLPAAIDRVALGVKHTTSAYSAESIHRIRLIASTHSTGWRPPIPLHCVHRFRSIAST